MTILARLRFDAPSADLSFRKRFRLFFTVASVVVPLGGVKTAVHYFGLEFLQLNALLTSGIGGAIFIIGFLLSGILADYKEAERIPAEIRTAMEAINGDLTCFAKTKPEFDLSECRRILLKIIGLLRSGLGHANEHKNIAPVLEEIDRLTPILGRLEGVGMASNSVVRLRTAQDSIRRNMLRILSHSEGSVRPFRPCPGADAGARDCIDDALPEDGRSAGIGDYVRFHILHVCLYALSRSAARTAVRQGACVIR
jgi:hypothetical protein